MTDENATINQTMQKSNIINQSKISSGVLNNELLKNIEVLEEENTQLKNALSELQEDLKDKENSIEESQKIITKLKDEYSKIIKELQNLEQQNNDLINQNELNKREIENAKKTNNLVSKLQNKNNELNSEINSLKKENLSLKSKINTNNTNTSRKDKDLKNKEFMINNLKQKSDNWLLMIKERENLLSEQSNKIKELNEIIKRQEEELKLMMNFSKNINKENKTNISEITKQAIKTIKLFYNSLNGGSKKNLIDNGYRIEFKNNNNKNLIYNFENVLKNNKISFLLEEGINGMMYIPKDLKSISKEFIMDMNLKTELIKSELYSSILRETQFIEFLQEIMGQFNTKDGEKIKSIRKIVAEFKSNMERITNENNSLKRNNKLLVQNKKDTDLLLKKIINDTNNNLKAFKEKYLNLINDMHSKLENLQKNNEQSQERSKKDNENFNKEINNLKEENNALKKNIEEYKRLLDIYKENEKLFKSLDENNFINAKTNRYRNISWKNIQIVSEERFYINHSYYKKININERYSHQKKKFKNNKNTNQNQGVINYNKKKKEIYNLKEEIQSVKREINNIMINSINSKEQLTSVPTKDIIPYRMASYDKENIVTSRSYIIKENNNDDNLQKKINSLQKSLKKEKNKIINLETENISLKQQITNLNNNLNNKKENNINNTFTPSFFINIFYNINSKIFSSSELKKYYKIYNTSDISTVFEIFIESCECLKKQIYEINYEIDSPNSDIEDNYVNSKNVAIDNSYRSVNERILKLKKLEFDFQNLSEFIKNYLVSQEIIVNIIFNNRNDMIEFEPIEKLYNLFEECLNYKIDEMSDNVIFYRKLFIRIFKNQKNCLGLSLESYSQE